MSEIRQHPVFWSGMAVVVLCTSSILFGDRPIAAAMKLAVHGDAEAFFKAVTNLGRAELYMVPAGLLWLLARWQGWAGWQRRAGYVFATMASAGLVELAVKFILGRTRPKLWFEQGAFTLHPFSHGWEVNSFPSGHSQAGWAAMIALAVLFPRLRWLFVVVAVLVASSRVFLTVHWASDAMAGAWLGFAAAMVWRRMLAPANGS